MSRTRRLLLLALVAICSTAALMLGRWQLHRLSERRARNAVFAAALSQPAVDLTTTPLDTMLNGRRIVARGTFDPSAQVLLRGRAHKSAPGLHVVTAFQPEGGHHRIWVLRGFVPSPDASTPPDSIPVPTPGVVPISGIVQLVPRTDDRGQPIGTGAGRTLRRLDRAALAALVPDGGDAYVLLSGPAIGPGQLPTVEPPSVDDGPHLSYAIQWFGIALAIAAFGVIVIRRDGRAPPRRRAAP